MTAVNPKPIFILHNEKEAIAGSGIKKYLLFILLQTSLDTLRSLDLPEWLTINETKGTKLFICPEETFTYS